MKAIILSTLLLSLTGCKYVEYQFMSSMDIAQRECSQIHKEGTERWLQCVEIQAMSIRSKR